MSHWAPARQVGQTAMAGKMKRFFRDVPMPGILEIRDKLLAGPADKDVLWKDEDITIIYDKKTGDMLRFDGLKPRLFSYAAG